MQIVLVTRHIARAATLYAPVIKALSDGESQLTLVGAAGTDALIAERKGLITREVALRPFGQRPIALEWSVLAGDLLSMMDRGSSERAPIDVLISFEPDLHGAVSMAARAVRARLVVVATDVLAQPTVVERVKRTWGPMWSALQERTQALLPAAAEDVSQAIQEQLRMLAAETQTAWKSTQLHMPEAVREAGDAAWQSVAHAATELKAYGQAPTTHYLLREPPHDWNPPGGWTDFQFGTGIDLDAYLHEGAVRSADDAMAVGMHVDFFGELFARQAIAPGARDAVTQHASDIAVWRTFDASKLSPNDALLPAQSRYVRGLDVAIVPGGDLYAAMQAAAAGCVVVTEQDSLAARTFRDGESGFALPALDSVQITQVLRRLQDVDRRVAMQEAAQRRALRLFDARFFLRRLTRGMETHLEVQGATGTSAERRMRRHI